MRRAERHGLVQAPRCLRSEALASPTLVYPNPLHNQRQESLSACGYPLAPAPPAPACHLCARKRVLVKHTEQSPRTHLLHTAGAHMCGVRHTIDRSQRGA
jgi:hypothetical protein